MLSFPQWRFGTGSVSPTIIVTRQRYVSTKAAPPDKTLVLDDFSFQCGASVSQVPLVYQTYGSLNKDRSNVILYPTSYGAHHSDIEWLIHKDGILDSSKYFIIVPNMFGSGRSFSPSTSNDYYKHNPDFYTTHYDNVRAQKTLLESLNLTQPLALVYGWSMGAQQAYHWATMYPHLTPKIAALCGTARTTPHNKLFLYSLRAALQADPNWKGTHFDGVPNRGFHAFAQIYASWAASQEYYQQEYYLDWGYSSLEDYIWKGWEANYRKRDPHDLLAMLETWLRNDVSHNTDMGDYETAMTSIRAQCLIMPATTDLYFTPDDCQREADLIANATFLPIPSIWGHRAGNPYQNPEDEAFIKKAVRDFLLK